jgi:hypothetical protein
MQRVPEVVHARRERGRSPARVRRGVPRPAPQPARTQQAPRVLGRASRGRARPAAKVPGRHQGGAMSRATLGRQTRGPALETASNRGHDHKAVTSYPPTRSGENYSKIRRKRGQGGRMSRASLGAGSPGKWLSIGARRGQRHEPVWRWMTRTWLVRGRDRRRSRRASRRDRRSRRALVAPAPRRLLGAGGYARVAETARPALAHSRVRARGGVVEVFDGFKRLRAARGLVLGRWRQGRRPERRGSGHTARSVAETITLDVTTIRRSAGRLQACLTATPFGALGPAADVVGRGLGDLQGVLGALTKTIAAAIERASVA